jgi:CheY-like chemotaxis protein
MNVKSIKRFILVADDDIDDQEMISESLHDLDENCTIEVVSNGQLAINRLENTSLPHPCLVILDLNMPVLDGLQTLALIREMPALQGIPVVVFTTSDSSDSRKKSLKLGALDYLVKPDDYKGILAVTAKMMEYCR